MYEHDRVKPHTEEPPIRDDNHLISGYKVFRIYEELVLRTVKVLNSKGLILEPFNHAQDSIFKDLSPVKQQLIISALENYYALINSAVLAGVDFFEEKHAAAWWIIRSLGWHPTSDIFSRITGNDIVEIYDAQHLQVFRSFKMFKFISYTLDDLMTYEWAKLYSRPPGTEELVMYAIQKSMREVRTISGESGDKHLISERFSKRMLKAIYEPIAVSPLLSRSNKVVGYINLIGVSALEN